MKQFRILLVLILFAASSAPAQAQGLFGGKKAKSTPEKQVEELIMTAQTGADATQRANAVQDLREFSAATYPQIVPVLVHLLQSDNNINVRLEAAQSLGRIRPATKIAGDALAEAAAKDSALRVRWQARTSLALHNLAASSGTLQGGADASASKVKVSDKTAPKGANSDTILIPQPGASMLVPGISGPTPTGGYALPLPAGPAQTPVIAPLPAPGTNLPAKPDPPSSTGAEPPLIPPAPLPMNPGNIPAPIQIPDVGPILAPPQ